jgi:hypothetical protein
MSVKPMTVTAPKTETIAMSPRGEKAFPPNFGAEAMIQWLYSQMRASNKDVQTTLKEVENDRQKLNHLSKLQQVLRDMKAACVKDGDDVKAPTSSSSTDFGQYRTERETGETYKDWVTDPATGMKTLVDIPIKEPCLDKGKLESEDWYKALSADGKAAMEMFIWNYTGSGGKMPEKQIDAALDKIKDEISALNSNNEIQMINLQHVMQTRNQAIQLASNIISVVDRAADTAINNIGKG